MGSELSVILSPINEAIFSPSQNQITVDKTIQIIAEEKKTFGLGKKHSNIEFLLKI
jgi:hypothetical protein